VFHISVWESFEIYLVWLSLLAPRVDGTSICNAVYNDHWLICCSESAIFWLI